MTSNLSRRLALLERPDAGDKVPIIFVLRAGRHDDNLVTLGDFVRELGENADAFKARVSAQHRPGLRVLMAGYNDAAQHDVLPTPVVLPFLVTTTIA